MFIDLIVVSRFVLLLLFVCGKQFNRSRRKKNPPFFFPNSFKSTQSDLQIWTKASESLEEAKTAQKCSKHKIQALLRVA